MYFKDLQPYLQNLMEDRVTQSDIAKALNITTGAVSLRNKTNSKVRLDEIKKIEKHFLVNLRSEDAYNYNELGKDVNIGKNIQSVRKFLNFTVKQVAEEMNMNARTLGSYERGESQPPHDFVIKYAERYNVNYDFLLLNRGPMFNDIQEEEPRPQTETDDIIEIEQIDGIRPECGAGAELLCEPHIEPFRISRSSITSYLRCSEPSNLKTFRASGDSMSHTIDDGDWLLVDVGRRDASVSGVYIFLANGFCRCKRLNMTLDGRLEVKSDNPKYKDELVSPNDNIEITIIGRVLNNLSRGL